MMHDADAGVGDLVAFDSTHLRGVNSALYLPTNIQKNHPTELPSSAIFVFASDVSQLPSLYLTNHGSLRSVFNRFRHIQVHPVFSRPVLKEAE
ncbi:hypothetical protein SAMN06264855_103261 [Halorubrum vacuolatum]|uniref:Uncharacterized protein n=1 Tax=Halorubrum vacuolatum TaxID=63740 RepID=A0A238VQC1_HALVU|nr:hypothetical protein SAMN06264855_103261 [Halorubrum vacuolatum]